MSVTFESPSIPLDLQDATTYLNVGNANAVDLLAWLWLPASSPEDLYGSIPARELTARCRRRLWDEPRNYDEGLPAVERRLSRFEGGPNPVVVPDPALRLVAHLGDPVESELGARHVFCGRRAGYLREKTEQLLRLAQRAGESDVRWA